MTDEERKRWCKTHIGDLSSELPRGVEPHDVHRDTRTALAAMRAEAESWAARVAELERLGGYLLFCLEDGTCEQCEIADECDECEGAMKAWRAARKDVS